MTATRHPPTTTLGRFGIETLIDSAELFVATITMAGLVNPVTGLPTAAPLAVLVDYVGGLVNHHRRAADEWTVSSELSMDLCADALAHIARSPAVPVVARARPFGGTGSSSLGLCDITHADTVLGTGLVRSVHIKLPGEFPSLPSLIENGSPPTVLGEMMALQVGSANGDSTVLFQSPDPVLNNTTGIVHGGVAAAGLELAASAALNTRRNDEPLKTASLRVNYLRPFLSGGESRYLGTSLRVGYRSGVGEAQAISTAGEVALTGRITGYR